MKQHGHPTEVQFNSPELERLNLSGETVGSLFLKAARAVPERNFLVHPNGTHLTYEATAKRIASAVAGLQLHGLRPGDHLLAYCDEPATSLQLILACAVSGIVFTPVSPVYTVEYAFNMADRLGTRFIFCHESHLRRFSNPGGRVILSFGVEKGQIDLYAGLERQAAYDRLERLCAKVDERALFMVQPTSGSTGQPKLSARSHRAVLRYPEYLVPQLPASQGHHKFAVIAPLTGAIAFHMLATALACQAEMCIPSAMDTSVSLSEIRRMDPSVIPATPRVLRALFKSYRNFPENSGTRVFGPSARYLLSAGAAGDGVLFRELIAQGMDVLEFYGSGETSLLALSPKGRWIEGYAGKLLPDTKYYLAADQELYVNSPGQMQGYVDDRGLNKEAFDENGLFKMGDIVEISAEGYLRVKGRKKDVFGKNGNAIYPERIETQLESIPGIRQAMVVGPEQPFLTAYLVTDASFPTAGGDGYLTPERHAQLYATIASFIAEMNVKQEPIEKIGRFSLFCKSFPQEIYAPTGPAKIRRDRPVFYKQFESHISALYTPGSRGRYLNLTAAAEIHDGLTPSPDGAGGERQERKAS